MLVTALGAGDPAVSNRHSACASYILMKRNKIRLEREDKVISRMVISNRSII